MVDSISAIQTIGLTKAFGRRVVVKKVNLTVRPGEVYGLLGPNGAGKTTLIRLLLGLVQPTSGGIHLFGQSSPYGQSEQHRRIGVVGEHSRIYDDMTAREYLNFFARLNGLRSPEKAIDDLLERVDLAPFGDLVAATFSQGMQKRLNLARALLHQPEVLILDEITSGLDPNGVIRVRDLLYEERKLGRSVLISSHILSEVEKVADRVGVMKKGELIFEGTVEQISQKAKPNIIVEVELTNILPGVIEALQVLSGVVSVKVNGSVLVLKLTDRDAREAVSACITSAGGVIVGMKTITPSLEDAFLYLTNTEVGKDG